jgi:hypothetical protein
MTWLMVLAFYSHGNLAYADSLKFSSKLSCETAAQEIRKTFDTKDDSVKHVCVQSWVRKKKYGK